MDNAVLTPAAQADLWNHYETLITTVAAEVAREFNAKGGSRGHGWEMLQADDVAQAAYLWLVEHGRGREFLDALDIPRAYLRTITRNVVRNEVRQRRRSVVADFAGSDPRDEDRTPGYGWVLLDARYSSETGLPERDVVTASLMEQVLKTVEGILNRVTSITQRDVARLYYFEGLDSNEVGDRLGISPAAARKALQRAREELGPKAEASLRAWRLFSHPDSKRPKGDAEAPAEALLRLI